MFLFRVANFGSLFPIMHSSNVKKKTGSKIQTLKNKTINCQYHVIVYVSLMCHNTYIHAMRAHQSNSIQISNNQLKPCVHAQSPYKSDNQNLFLPMAMLREYISFYYHDAILRGCERSIKKSIPNISNLSLCCIHNPNNFSCTLSTKFPKPKTVHTSYLDTCTWS